MADDKHHDEKDDHGKGSHKGGGHGHGGGSHEEHEGVPEWMISFADNTALMMALFVILLALNMSKPSTGGIGGEAAMGGSPDSPEVLDWVLDIREGFNNKVDINGTDPAEASLRERLKQRQRISEGEAENPGPEGKHRDTQATPPSHYYRTGGVVPFAEGERVLSARGRAIVAEAAMKLKGERWVIEVRGYSSPFETFDEHLASRRLSYDRAEAVAKALIAEGLRWEQLRLVAAGDSSRLVARPEDRVSDAPNRRVEIMVTRETQPDELHRSPN